MKIVSFDELRHNRYFWLYFLSVCFPLAMDEEENMPLSDYICEQYDCTGEAAVWVDRFVQFSEEIMQKNGGYADNPTAVQFPLGNDIFTVQFHPGDTVFFMNNNQVCSTGGDYQVHRLNFAGLNYYAALPEVSGKAVLLLPMVYVTEEEKPAALVLIRRLLADAPFSPAERETIADMILTGLTE